MTEKITNCYKAKDGKLFESEIETKQYEVKLDFKEWYKSKPWKEGEKDHNLLLYKDDFTIRGFDIDKIQYWLLKHKKEIINFILSYGEEKNV